MSERYQREIEEILEQASEALPGKGRKQRSHRSIFAAIGSILGGMLGGKKWAITPGRLMLIAVALILSALIVRAMTPGIVAPLLWAGLFLFIVAYGLFFIRPWPQYEKRWRGRLVEEYDNPWWERIRRRLKLK